MSLRHHAIDYVELPARDLPAAQAFYAAAFGWRFRGYGPGYAGILRGEGPEEAGGLRSDPDAPTPAGGPLVILYSDDLEATLAAVKEAGGAVVAPIVSFPGGRRFEFEDPSGNRLAVWTRA